MQSEATRAAFTLSPIHQRRDQHRITSVAVLQNATRVFLGLDNGVLEEHSCLASTAAGGMPLVVAAAAGGMLVLRLLAEKKVFNKQALTEICAAEAAARLVCLSEEGQVALVSLETFAVVPLPAARGAVALAVQHTQHLPVLLAVATKHGKGKSKVLVFNVLPGANVTGGHQPAVLVAQASVPSAVLGLTWASKSLLLAVPGGYSALTPASQQPTAAAAGNSSGMTYHLTVLADHLHDISPMLGCVPDLGLGLMLWEQNMVLVTDATGAAVREPLQLPMPPLSLTSAGMFVVALCDDGIHVFDRNNSREVQHIDFAHDDAYVRLQQRLPAAADEGGRAIVIATSEAVLRLEPIAIEQQVRELLKRKRFDQALNLVSATPPAAAAAAAAAADDHNQHSPAAAGGRPAWQHIGLAQAGLLLLLECEFDAGLNVLEGLPPVVWQPCQLFSMFPGVTARWLSQVPSRSYWGLHGHHLPDLQQLINDMLELKAATAPRQQHHTQQQYPQQQQQQSGLITSSVHSSPSSLSSSSLAIPAATADAAESDKLTQQAETAVAGYLSKVRCRPGVILLDGIDTLLLQLLSDVGDAAAVEALVSSSSNTAIVSTAAAALRAAERWHGLALLKMNARQPEEALMIWKSLAAGELQESPSSTGAVAAANGNAAAVAVTAAAAAMAAGPERVSVDLLLSSGSLRWLLGQDAAAGLAVLEARQDLNPQEVMKLLEETGDIDLRWQYLYHLVHQSSSNSSGDGQLHTQLAAVLLAAIAPLISRSSSVGSSSSSSDGSSSSSSGPLATATVGPAQLASMVERLPLLLEPNTQQEMNQQPRQTPARNEPAATADVGTLAGSTSSSRGYASLLGSGFGGLRGQGLRSLSSVGGSRVGNLLQASHHSRNPSLMGAGIPSAFYFASSVADINKRAGKEQRATTADAGAQSRLQQQQRSLKDQHQAPQQQRWQQQHTTVGALAGAHVVRRPPASAVDQLPAASVFEALHRQGTATQANLLHPMLSSAGMRAGAWGVQPSLGTTQNNIAQLLLQQDQHQLQSQSSLGADGRLQQQQQLKQQQQGAGLRALPAGFGPWPLTPLDQPDHQGSSASSSSTRPAQPPAADAEVQHRDAGSDRQSSVAVGSSEADAAVESAVYEKVLLLRCLLVYHLQASLLYDVQAVLAPADQLPLYPEQALLHSRAGNHPAALALLALYPPLLVEGAISYCRSLGSAEAWLTLLELFLNPQQTIEGLGWLDPNTCSASGAGVVTQGISSAALESVTLEPDYGSACRVLNAEGANLNPLRLLAALPADMPLHLAGELLGYVVCGLQHRSRYGQVVRNLQRCRRLGGHAELVELQNQRVLVTDDTACNGCGRFIGSKVFYRYPSGVVVCSRCSGAIAAAGAGGCSTSSGGAAAGGLPHASMGDSTWEFV